MGLFKKLGGFIKKNAKKIGKGALKVASVGASFVPGVGGVASMALNKLSDNMSTSPVGGIGTNPNPALGGMAAQKNLSLGGITIEPPTVKIESKQPEKEPANNDSNNAKPIPPAIKWGAVGLAAKMLLGI